MSEIEKNADFWKRFEEQKVKTWANVYYYDEHVLAWRAEQLESKATAAWLKSVYPGWK